jgi:hypothetical protein
MKPFDAEDLAFSFGCFNRSPTGERSSANWRTNVRQLANGRSPVGERLKHAGQTGTLS